MNELKNYKQWVCWDYEQGRKVLKNPATKKWAATNNPSDWTTYGYAKDMKHHHKGLGFVFTAHDPFTGIDLDKCVNNGKVDQWAMEIINNLNSYTEISPSGTGVKIWVKAVTPRNGKGIDKRIEVYDRGRYFTVTGNHLAGTPETIENRQSEIEALITKHFPKVSEIDPERKQTAFPETSLDERVRAWREHLNKCGKPVSGKGEAMGYCFALAMAAIHGCCLSVEEALPDFLRWGELGVNADGFSDPWTEKELRRKLEDASQENSEKGRGYLLPTAQLPEDFDFGAPEPEPEKPVTIEDMYSQYFYDAHSFCEAADKEQQTYLVDPILPEGGLSMISGLSFAGKSTFIRWLIAHSLLTGKAALGYKVKPCQVLYINADNNPLRLMKEHFEAGNPDFEKSNNFHYFKLPERKLEAELVKKLVELIWLKLGKRVPILVVVDTMRPVLFEDCKAGDDKDAVVMTNKLKPYKTLTASKDMEGLLTILWLYHNARTTNEFYGSGAFMNLLDAYWNYKRTGNNSEIEVQTRRVEFPLKLVRIGGNFITEDAFNNRHSHEAAFQLLTGGKQISRNVLTDIGITKDIANLVMDTLKEYKVIEEGKNQQWKATSDYLANWQRLLTERKW